MPLFKNIILNLLVAILCSSAIAERSQISIKKVESMPNLPQPYIMRDWDKVANDFDSILFDSKKEGMYLPLIKFDNKPGSANKEIFYIPSYVGINRDETEGIACIGALSSSLIAGIDKRNQNNKNYFDIVTNYFNVEKGLYLNDFSLPTGNSFWYEIFPSVLFYRIYHFSPKTSLLQKQFYSTADNWYQACVTMGGKNSPWQTPNFDYTAFSFEKMKPIDNTVWKEADVSAATAWLEYMAYIESGEEKYLDATKWSMDYLQASNKNPFYEVLMPLGAYTAARMNAELGTNYDTKRFINWCFEGNNHRQWGITTGKWGVHDCSGLVGSVANKKNMYAFTMNSFDLACSIVPIVRYDDRFADSIGKWILNLANNARLFYSNSLAKDQQTDYDWAKKYDPQACIAYEGLRQKCIEIDRVQSNYKTIAGRIVSGSVEEIKGTNKIYQCLEEDNNGRLEHIWQVKLSQANKHYLSVVAKTQDTDDEQFSFSYSENANGPFQPLFNVLSANNHEYTGQIITNSDTIYLKVTDTQTTDKMQTKNSIYIDDIWVVSKSSNAPFATGDAKTSGWGKTNLGIYGSGYVGILAGIVDKTNVEGILQLDCLATDFYHVSAYPTYLYYNPYAKAKRVKIDIGNTPKDIYESTENKFIAKNVSGQADININPKSSIVIVICPANGNLTHSENKTLVNNIVIDY